MSNITLINPPYLELKSNYSSICHPPLGLCYVASYMRKVGHSVQIIDAVSEGMDKRFPYPGNVDITIIGLNIDEIVDNISLNHDIIGISCMFTPCWPSLRELIKAIKKKFPKTPLVIGGEHATSMWDVVLSTSPVDFCVLGEGEVTFGELVNAIKNGSDMSKIEGIAYRKANTPFANKPRPRIKDIDSLPLPAWDLIDIEKYIKRRLFMGACKGRTIPILTTRGCPYRCRFCTAENMWKGIWIHRNVEQIVDEIELYIEKYNTNDFHLMDLNAIIRKDWILKLSKEILRRKLEITWQLPVGTGTAAIDKEVTNLLVQSGCRNITFAPESGSKRILAKMGKTIDILQLERSIRAALASGMTICLFFLIGFPEEKIQDIRETFKLIRKMAFRGVHEIALSTFIPIPGSYIFNELKLKDPKQFELTDEFCYNLFSSLSLDKTNSWDLHLNSKKLLALKMRGLIMFYSISYIMRPWRLMKLLINLFTGKQETKVDRVLREMILKRKYRPTQSSKSCLSFIMTGKTKREVNERDLQFKKVQKGGV